MIEATLVEDFFLLAAFVLRLPMFPPYPPHRQAVGAVEAAALRVEPLSVARSGLVSGGPIGGRGTGLGPGGRPGGAGRGDFSGVLLSTGHF